MDFTLALTEEQKQIKALVTEFCKREVDMKEMWELAYKAGRVTTVEELRAIQPWGLINKMNEVGLRQLAVPKEYGGGGLTVGANLILVILGEELGYWGGPVGRLLTKNWQTCATAASPNVTRKQKDWFFPKFMENPVGLIAHIASEPQGTADLTLPWDEPGTTLKRLAYKDGKEWVINGDGMFSSGGGVAHFLWVLVRTDKEGPVSQSTSLFWVLNDTPGLSFTVHKYAIADIYGNAQVHFDNVRIPEIQMVGQVNQGLVLMGDLLNKKMIFPSSLLGYARRAYEHMVDYAKERVQGGKPIIQHSMIASLLGEAAIELEAARAFLYQACREVDQAEIAGAHADMFWSMSCMWLIKRVSMFISQIAADIYGGLLGSTDLPPVNLLANAYFFLPGGATPHFECAKASMLYNNHTLGEPWKKAKVTRAR